MNRYFPLVKVLSTNKLFSESYITKSMYMRPYHSNHGLLKQLIVMYVTDKYFEFSNLCPSNNMHYTDIPTSYIKLLQFSMVFLPSTKPMPSSPGTNDPSGLTPTY